MKGFESQAKKLNSINSKELLKAFKQGSFKKKLKNKQVSFLLK